MAVPRERQLDSTFSLLREGYRFIQRREVPPQDPGYSLSRMPALPKSRFVMTNVRRC
jgi:hypothetical protein